MSIPIQGDLPDQRTPEFQDVHGPGQVENNEGGFVNKLDDMQRLKRFVILGCDGSRYYVNDDMLTQKNIDCIKRLIAAGRGQEAVQMIKQMSVERRNLRQQSLLHALAVLARCHHTETKEAAYKVLSDVCRIPTQLYLFVEYCEAVSRSSTEGGGTGWGRAHRTAVCQWFYSFDTQPKKLARLVTKYKRRFNTTIIDVLRRCHPKRDPSPETICVEFILKYIAKGLTEAKQAYQTSVNSNECLRQVAEYLSGCDLAMTTNRPDDLCSLIGEHQLSWEHCQTNMLNNSSVWSALLPHMGVQALIRNLAKMTRTGVFPADSWQEDMAVGKIRSINSDGDVREEEEEEIELSWQHNGRRANILHPYQILIGWMNYKNGHGEFGRGRWEPNESILKALEEAYYRAYQLVEPTGKKFFLAVHMSAAMSKVAIGPDYRSNPLDYSVAAATMMMVTRRTEQNAIIKALGDRVYDLSIERDDDLYTVVKKSFPIQYGGTDLAQPMKYAIEEGIKDIDVFVIYTDSETVDGNVHATEALRQYRTVSENARVKLIVCAMVATEFTIADPDDQDMLNIVGFDSAAPRVISEFVRGH